MADHCILTQKFSVTDGQLTLRSVARLMIFEPLDLGYSVSAVLQTTSSEIIESTDTSRRRAGVKLKVL